MARNWRILAQSAMLAACVSVLFECRLWYSALYGSGWSKRLIAASCCWDGWQQRSTVNSGCVAAFIVPQYSAAAFLSTWARQPS